MWKLHFACLKKSGWDIKKSHLAFPDVIHSSMNGPLKSVFYLKACFCGVVNHILHLLHINYIRSYGLSVRKRDVLYWKLPCPS